MVARLRGICSQFEGYKPGQNRCRIELANDAFEIAKTSRQRVHGNDIPVTGRCQGDKAQIEKCAGECRVVLERDPLECIWNRQADKREQRCEGHRNQQIQKDRSDYSVIRDAASPEHCPSDHNSESDRDDKPCGGQQVQVVWPRPVSLDVSKCFPLRSGAPGSLLAASENARPADATFDVGKGIHNGHYQRRGLSI